MTISTTASQTTVLGNGVTTTFSFSFIYDASTYITVVYTDADGAMTVLAPSQYTLFLNSAAAGQLWGVGGTVTYPLSGSPIANGTSLLILRTLPLQQLTSISNQGSFAPQVIEQALDTNCMQTQQVSARTGQLRGTWTSGTDYNYSDVVQDGANGTDTQNYYMCAIANTSTIWATDLAAGDWSLAINIQQISGYATSAAASAVAAAVSAAAASTSASSASTSATTASTASTNAATSATTASTAATTASTAATTASTAATTASSAATSASTSATNAATSATSATTSATSASTSATAAAASAVLAASTLTATSTSSNSIGTGAKTYTIQTNKQFQGGQYITANNGVNSNAGTVTSYDPVTGIFVMSVSTATGSGTFTSWNISISGQPGANGVGSGTVTSVAVTTANGVSASVSSPTSTPTISFTLGDITPSSVATGTVSVTGQITSTLATGTAPLVIASTTKVNNLYVARAALGDTVTTNANLTGDVTSSGNATTIGAKKVVATMLGSGAATANQVARADGSGGVTYANQLVTSVATRTGAVTLANTDISGLGTAATLNVGTGASQIVQLTAASKLPAVDGSLLTNLPTTSGGLTAAGYVTVSGTTPTKITALNFATVTYDGSNGAFSVTFTSTLGTSNPVVVASVTSASSSLAFKMTARSNAGFSIQCYNASGVGSNPTSFDFMVYG